MEAALQTNFSERGDPRPDGAQRPDERLVASVLAGDHRAFEMLMRRYNQRLFRIARGILRDDAEAEDVVQEAYVRAYLRLGQLSEGAAFGGWLARIAANEALERARQGRWARRSGAAVSENTVQDHAEQMLMAGLARNPTTPEEAAAGRETRRLIEAAIDALPDAFRSVFVLRAVEQLSTDETAACLGLRPVTVKTRYFRAKMLLRKALERQMTVQATAAFPAAGARCDRIVAAVLGRIASLPPAQGAPGAEMDGATNESPGAGAGGPGSMTISTQPRNDRRTR